MNIVCGAIGLFKSFFHIGIVDYDTLAKRIVVCWGCINHNICGSKCPDCGCFLKHKVRLKSEKCPRGKW